MYLLSFLGVVLSVTAFSGEIPKEAVEQVRYLGGTGLIKGQRNAAYGIADNHQGTVFIGDLHHNVLRLFDKNLREISRIAVKQPHGVDIDAHDDIYVSSFLDGRVYKFDPTGEEIANWDERLRKRGKIRKPVAAGFDNKGNVYIAEYSGSIIKASLRGEYVQSFDLRKFQKEGVFRPHGFFIENGQVYVAARPPYQGIHIFDTEGNYKKTWPQPAFPFDPVAVRAYDDQYLCIPNYAQSRVEIFNRKGDYYGCLGAKGEEDGEFLAVMNVLILEGYGYFIEEQGNRVQKIHLKPLMNAGPEPVVEIKDP